MWLSGSYSGTVKTLSYILSTIKWRVTQAQITIYKTSNLYMFLVVCKVVLYDDLDKNQTPTKIINSNVARQLKALWRPSKAKKAVTSNGGCHGLLPPSLLLKPLWCCKIHFDKVLYLWSKFRCVTNIRSGLQTKHFLLSGSCPVTGLFPCQTGLFINVEISGRLRIYVFHHLILSPVFLDGRKHNLVYLFYILMTD